MSEKSILVVDDDKFILTFLEHSLKKFEPDYRVKTVLSGPEALEQLQANKYDLVITDYLMPGISGVDLANAVRYMTPKTAVVLMTAYATDQLTHTIEMLHVDGYIRKPLNLSQVRQVIRKTIGSSREPTGSFSTIDLKQLEQEVNKHLQTLYLNTGSRFVILVNAGGQIVEIVGPAEKAEAHQIATLVSANFMAAKKLTALLKGKSSYVSSTFTADDHDVYTYNVDDNFLLAVVFDTSTRPGIVSVYTKQTAESLVPLIHHFPEDRFPAHIQLIVDLQTNGNAS